MTNLEKWLELQEIKNYGIDIDDGKILPEDSGVNLDDLDLEAIEELEDYEVII